MAVLTALAALSALRGNGHLGRVLLAAAATSFVITLIRPAIGHAIERVALRFGHLVGAVLTTVLMGVFWLVLVVPVSLLNRAARIDLLSAIGSCERRPDRRPLPRRAFGRERRLRGHLAGRTLRVVAVVAVVAVAAVAVYEKETTVRAPVDSPFGPAASGPPSGTVYHDTWVVFEARRVSEHLFPGEPWGRDVLLAQDNADMHFQTDDPKYGWRNLDVDVPYTTVVGGHRVTYEIPDPTLTIWLFGGSTVYGFGQRDEHTIASELVREAQAHGHAVRVVNFGVPAYVNWQETQVFEDELGRGERPDLAVFLDGANDMKLAWERELWNLLDASQPTVLAATRALQEQRQAAVDASGYTIADRDCTLPTCGYHDLDREARLAAEQYRMGVEKARRLGRQHGVAVAHFWQPFVATMPPDAPGVATVLDTMDMDADFLAQSQQAVRDAARLSGVHPIDITDMFDNATQPEFFDWAHTNEHGARLEAAVMYRYLDPVIDQLDRASD